MSEPAGDDAGGGCQCDGSRQVSVCPHGEGEFKGVRTFAQQVKHTAATHYILGAAIVGVAPTPDAGDETGPPAARTKPEIQEYLKGSFAYLYPGGGHHGRPKCGRFKHSDLSAGKRDHSPRTGNRGDRASQ